MKVDCTIWRRMLPALAALMLVNTAQAQDEKPNILVIWGDDIGWQNVSAYGMGTMGYTTPNIDQIGNEGIRFTDHYAQPSCTAGRAAFADRHDTRSAAGRGLGGGRPRRPMEGRLQPPPRLQARDLRNGALHRR